ncbi:circadian clock protein LdpA [Geminocystis sp. NIES-3709]|uniref:circadian clock protein LdpA n=1 Tax=Geminocystis sp. NIES-3709 TaxID=1617448 RepID=UPI00156AED0D|nr:LdpA C-terminal domain-containing domain [Geminocystis sp. NIES-3709]
MLLPLESLKQGRWFKLICGASYQHLPSIRNLALIYTLAGADCLDVAPDKAVIHSALEGIKIAQNYRQQAIDLGYNPHIRPLLMVSINDGEDPHFRKAYFNTNLCSIDCPRPCEKICPAEAIKFDDRTIPIVNQHQGIVEELCYGCGRCLPICPINIIHTESRIISTKEVLQWLDTLPINAIEIHTKQGHLQNFIQVWDMVKPRLQQLQLIAISCPYTDTVTEYLTEIYQYIHPVNIPLIWQTDGRPMSGDIGSGTTHLTIKYAQKMKQTNLPGFIQLAGGTNEYTIEKLNKLNLTPSKISGVAYGSKGRKIIADTLQRLEEMSTNNQIEEHPQLLWEAVTQAFQLVSPIKKR